MDRTPAAETVGLGSIPGRVKPKTLNIGFIASPFHVFHRKGQCEASTVCGRFVGRWQLDSEDRKVSSLSPGQNKLVNKM